MKHIAEQERASKGERWKDRQTERISEFKCKTDGEKGGNGEKKPLGESIIRPLPSSGAAANGSG